MKKIIIILIFFSNVIFAQNWEFIPFPTQLPTDYINGINTRRDFLVNQTTLYKNHLVFVHPYDGFTIYTGKEWKFYTPKKIREIIENKETAKSLNLNNISLFNCYTDSNNNVWMCNYEAVFKYSENPEKIKIYNTFKLKNGIKVKVNYINELFISNNNVYCRIFFYDSTILKNFVVAKYFVFNSTDDSFIEKFDVEVNNNKMFNPLHSLIDSQGNIFNAANLVCPDMLGSSYFNEKLTFYSNKDTIIKIYGNKLYIFYRGNLIEVDSNIANFKSQDTSLAENFLSFEMGVYNKSNIYIYAFMDDFYPFNSRSKIYRQNINNNIVDTISVPLSFKYNKTNISAKEFCITDEGKIILIYPGTGLYIYDPNSSVTEGDEDLMFVVGVNVHKMYPNPTSDKCHIDFFLNRLHVNNIKVQISDINGKIYKDISQDISYNSSTQDASLDFSVADIPQGNYYVLFTTSKNKQMRGLLILK